MIETEFTPYAAMAGGALIGLASVMLMALRGRIFGATGILLGVMRPASSSDWTWRALLLAGMFTGPLIYMLFAGTGPAIQVPVTPAALIIGGLLVGLGVTYGGGCTSGHGVCGMARLSPRSFVATGSFMIATTITVFVIRHVIGG